MNVSVWVYSDVQVICRLCSGKLERLQWWLLAKVHFSGEISSVGDGGGGGHGRVGRFHGHGVILM